MRVLAAEVETAAPFAASLAAGAPRAIDYRRASWTASAPERVLEEMWPLARDLLSRLDRGVALVEVADAIRLVAERHRVIARRRGRRARSPPPSPAEPGGEAGVCVISGGNIDPAKLAPILAGGMP